MQTARSRVVRHFVQCGLVLVACLSSLQAATLQRLTLDDMISKSTAIVRGTVSDSYAAFSGPVIYTHYRVQVTEQLKGANQTSIDVVVPGGTANNLVQTFPGAPQLKAGDDLVLFLWTSKAGLTQILGLTQGLFRVAGGSSDPVATRTASSELMLEPLTGQAVKDQTLVMKLSDLRARIASGGK